MSSKIVILADDNLTLEDHKIILQNSSYDQYVALSQQIYNLSQGKPVAGDPLPNIINKSKYTLVHGILHDEQNLGEGQPNVMRLIDFDNQNLYDLKVTDILSKINFSIDENNKILISCKQGEKINGIDISGMGIASMLFNIFDRNGILDAESDISLNLINNNINDKFIFSISGEITGTYSSSKHFNDSFDLTNNVELIIQNNNLLIKNNQNNSPSNYLKSIKFKIECNNNLLNDSDIFIYITPSSVYNLSYNSLSQEFEINLNNLFINNQDINYIQYNSNYFNIGIILPYAYHIQKENNLGEKNISYYNINNLSFNKKNLLILSPNSKILGELVNN